MIIWISLSETIGWRQMYVYVFIEKISVKKLGIGKKFGLGAAAPYSPPTQCWLPSTAIKTATYEKGKTSQYPGFDIFYQPTLYPSVYTTQISLNHSENCKVYKPGFLEWASLKYNSLDINTILGWEWWKIITLDKMHRNALLLDVLPDEASK